MWVQVNEGNPGYSAHEIRVLSYRSEWRSVERRDRLRPDLFRRPNAQARNYRKATGETERVSARQKLTDSEKELSGIIFDRLRENESFGRIRSKGDLALFGGRTTQDMKKKLAVPESRPLADFCRRSPSKPRTSPTKSQISTLSRTGFARSCRSPTSTSRTTLKSACSSGPRDRTRGASACRRRKKVARRLASEQKKLPGQVERLEGGPDSQS